MGQIKVTLSGSFGFREKTITAQSTGHADAVAQAIEFLVRRELPRAIAQDHRLHSEGARPTGGFGRPNAE